LPLQTLGDRLDAPTDRDRSLSVVSRFRVRVQLECAAAPTWTRRFARKSAGAPVLGDRV